MFGYVLCICLLACLPSRYLVQGIFCVLFFQWSFVAQAQNDSIRNLQEVKLSAFPLSAYTIGTKHTYLDSLATKQAVGQTLAQTLMEQTGIYLKQYGAGGLASVSFRGTGAAHTAVSWNGLPINSFTLGEVDFNSIVLASTSRVAILAGAGSSLYGSGSVGGSIQLYNTLPDSTENKVSGQFFQGAFGAFGGQLAYTIKKQKWALRQNIFAQTAQNNFIFQNTARFEKPIERQQNAQNTSKGVQTDLYFMPHVRHTFSVHTWIQDRQNQIAPTMGSNYQTHLYTQAHEKNLRLLGTYNHALPKQNTELTLKIGYLQDLYRYNLTEDIQTKTIFASSQYTNQLRHNINFRIGSSHTWIMALVDSYKETKYETRQEINTGLTWKPFTPLSVALNIRQMWVDNKIAPFTPSVGLTYRVGKAWHLKGFVGRTYRVPTLNDRFWAVGARGNPLLEPEQGITSEIGLQFIQKNNKTQWQFEVTPYRLWVKDWILWVPTNNIWSPQNLRTVYVRGIEAQASTQYTHRSWQIGKGITYTYAQSQTDNKQLAYTPLHRASVWLQGTYKGWLAYQNLSFTGFRYINLNNVEFLPAFILWNMSVGKTLVIAHQKITFQLRIDNMLDTQYQNYENRAMPQRGYTFSLRLN